ncbi:50S ribosomal protein L35 [Mycoplasma sp. SG1]|uniref:50S ribosomal protein L35 n=1 Tax=Mycoplasma sp. SG1 TaxID=2810348 RepID=UPI00202485A5|nr:50S ribosomal protein L35 [Mycoplasma sp. SG1]URM53196.1 50S ribosomal protein L35 [Mycoplasma sp. SG1]
MKKTKLKTRKSIAKRFKITARNKIMRHRAFKSHLATTKNPSKRRHLAKETVIDKTDRKRLLRGILNKLR